MKLAAVLLTLMLSASAFAAEECAWLSVDKVAKALPAYAPWETTSGGQVGSCQFMGSGAGAAIFSVSQMVQETSGEAQEMVLSMRTNLGADMRITDEAALGDKGFLYTQKTEAAGERGSLSLVGHRGRVVVLGSLMVPDRLTAKSTTSAIELTRNAFALAKDEAMLAAATRCAWFDQAVLRRMFAGASFTEQVYGSNSCIAYVESRVLMLAIVDDIDPATARAMLAGGACTLEPLAQLGEHGTLAHHCKEGNPRATVQYLHGSQRFEFSWIPGREPSENERKLLLELAAAAYTQP